MVNDVASVTSSLGLTIANSTMVSYFSNSGSMKEDLTIVNHVEKVGLSDFLGSMSCQNLAIENASFFLM